MIDEAIVCQMPDYVHYGLIFCVAVLEFWLGKTDKVKSGSLIELALNGFKAVAGKLKK